MLASWVLFFGNDLSLPPLMKSITTFWSPVLRPKFKGDSVFVGVRVASVVNEAHLFVSSCRKTCSEKADRCDMPVHTCSRSTFLLQTGSPPRTSNTKQLLQDLPGIFSIPSAYPIPFVFPSKSFNVVNPSCFSKFRIHL